MAPGGQTMRMRPAHTSGPTFLAYTPNGRKLVTVGANNTIRVFQTGSDGEPVNIDDCQESNSAVVAANDFFVVGSEEGSVVKYSLETNALDQTLVRCTLPIRDLALSPNRDWVAVASDELVVKIVNTSDMTRVMYIRDLPKPAKHVAFDFGGASLAVSCTDGVVYIYSIDSDEPRLAKKVDGLVRALETEDQVSSEVSWHPDGRALAAPTGTKDVQVVSVRDWERQRAFKGGHTGDITAAAWSPNGALLVTAGMDRAICLWETASQKIIKKYEDLRAAIWKFSWHPTENILSYTNNEGELYIHTDFVPAEHVAMLEKSLQRAPFIHDPLQEISGNANGHATADEKEAMRARRARAGTPDSLDDILGPDEMSDIDDFVEDDDGVGYAEVNTHGKRSNGHLELSDAPESKRRAVWHPWRHEPFQPGSTPWRGNRRYLCLNLIGFIWTVDQDTHHTVTVEFYDRDFHKDFHFTDPFGYDKACLSEKGTLFSSQAAGDRPAMIYYRPHETWTTRADWRSALPKGEGVTAIALSESYIVVTTSANYVRVFTLFGTPLRVHRHKSSPMVTCTSWRDYVLTISNGPVCANGKTQLLYSIENINRDEVCQSEDVVALPDDAGLQSVFFSDTGDPCIYDTNGTLLVLLHWRTPGQARWTPLLDTRQLERLADGRKEETYWPVAVAQERFYCIILKGGDRYPYFPRPLLNEFPFEVPLDAAPAPDAPAADTSTGAEAKRLEEAYVRTSVLHALQDDLVSATSATAAQRAELGEKALALDKILLQLLAAEAVEGEDKGMKALEIAALMRDASGRMMDAAGKIAARFGREVLGDKIRELAERRLVGLDDGDR